MLKVILAVVIGFIVWSILWLGSDALAAAVWSGFPDNKSDLEKGLQIGAISLWFNLFRGVLASLAAGYVAAWIAGRQSPMFAAFALGVLLLAFGVFVHVQYWNQMALWYHLLFLGLLIPVTLAGAKLRGA